MEGYAVSRATRLSRYAGLVGLVVIAALIAMPWWASRSLIGTATSFLGIVALAQMWNLLAGFGGLLSIGQQAFVGLGAYVVVILALQAGFNVYLAVPAAGIAAAAAAWVIAFLVFRLRGAYFGIGTWVVAELMRIVFANTSSLGGGSGISITGTLSGIGRWQREAYALWIAVALGLGSVALVYGLLRSARGVAFSAVRDSETAAESLGVSARSVKLTIYLIAAAGCGMVGALTAISNLRVSPDSAFSVDWTAIMFFSVVIGGIGTIEGPIVGAIVYLALRQSLAQYGGWYLIVLGVSAVAVMRNAPRGLWGSLADRFDIRLFPLEHRVTPKETV
jgi:branched-chain amino acid transport system permease protein